jgi:hypothetical protein
MNAQVEQLDFIEKRRVAIPDDYQQQTALKCRSRLHALRKCVELANFDHHKEVYLPLGIDQGQWSRIWAGTAYLDPEMLFPLMDLCGNDVPLRYDAIQRGYELVRIKSGLEAQLAQALTELADERRLTVRLAQALNSR